ncbi:MAG: AAA family ATPase [Proteobacteria bacterium]|nr:AAA family ATPase [Pseudomonadota bacterium]
MILKISLQNFRNFKSQTLPIEKQNIVLYGKNGCGKSNILEALSVFSIGKGLKKAASDDIIKATEDRFPEKPRGWSSKILLSGDIDLKTEYIVQEDGSGKRYSFAQGAPLKNASGFAEWISFLCITPETDRLFLDTPSTRRKFVDRFVYAKDSTHLKRVTRYEEAVRERLKILKTYGIHQKEWLSALEKIIVEEGLEIGFSRLSLLEQLSTFKPKGKEIGILPGFTAFMDGPFEKLLSLSSKSEMECVFFKTLEDMRFKDKESGMTNFGPHRSDLFVLHPLKNISVYQCSTGEQKVLLLSLLISYLEQFCLKKESLTVFLLDDVVAHLDEIHREVLYNRLLSEKGAPFQAWFSGTEKIFFSPLQSHSDMIDVTALL